MTSVYPAAENLAPDLLSDIRSASRHYFVERYQEIGVPTEEIYHDALHTYSVVETSDTIMDDPELFEAFEIGKELERYNQGIDAVTEQTLQTSEYPASISEEIKKHQDNLKINPEELKDLFGIAFYLHDIANWSRYSGRGRTLPSDVNAEDLAIMESQFYINAYLREKYDEAVPIDIIDMALKYQYFVRYVIDSTKLSSDSAELDEQNPKPFARFIKFCDRVGPYLNKSQSEVYDMVVGLSNEKSQKPTSVRHVEAKAVKLGLDFALNFPHYEVERILNTRQNPEGAKQILSILGKKGFRLYSRFVKLDLLSKPDQRFTWKNLYKFLSDPILKQQLLNSQLSAIQRING